MTVSDDEQMQADEGNWEEWDEDETEEDEPTKSLFSDNILPSPTAALKYDAVTHNFDFRQFRQKAKLDDYGVIKCINFIRTEVAGGRDPLPLLAAAKAGQSPWEDEKYLQPALADDALLFHDYEGDVEVLSGANGAPAEVVMAEAGVKSEAVDGGAAAAEIERLRAENESLREALQYSHSVALAAMPPDVAREVMQAQEEQAASQDMAAMSIEGGPSTSGTSGKSAVGGGRGSRNSGRESASAVHHAARTERINRNYFESYSGLNIHREMLSDRIRTSAYRTALEWNPELTNGKTVLDVGCGTGILSMFAARSGAARVIGIDGSTRIAGLAQQIVRANGLAAETGGPISIVAGRVEEINRLPVEKVDVIVSEWMGYALLFESMLDTVLLARDRWLKPGGAVLPDLCSIHMAGASEGATGLDFWRDVYGFDMSVMRVEAERASISRAAVVVVRQEDIITETADIVEFDLTTMKPADTDFSVPFYLRPKEGKAQECHAIVLWFDSDFSKRFCRSNPVRLSTSPFRQSTHWAQTVLALRHPILIAPLGPGGRPDGAAAAGIRGRISIARSVEHRSLDISLEYAAVMPDGTSRKPDVMVYTMSVL